MNKALHKIDLGLGGGSMLQIANRTHTQMMGYLITPPQSGTVVIDGGCRVADAEHLYALLSERGKKVDAWFITHAHDDHFGALQIMMESRPNFDIEIGAFYFSPAPMDFYKRVEGGNSYPLISAFRAQLKRCGIEECPMRRGDRIAVGGMTFEVLNDMAYAPYNDINSTTVCLRAHFPRRDVLFLGDLSQEAGEDLLKLLPPEKLRCDVVQMAHHGQNGVNRRFYEAVRPKVCLYCAPDWLWENDRGLFEHSPSTGRGTGNFKTLETRRWMEELGAELSCPAAYGDYLFY